MVDKIRRMFSSPEGKHLYERVLTTLDEYGMSPMLERGAVIGFSGGADSVMLSAFVYYHRERLAHDFPIALLHVNHNIRGDEAVRDAEFCERFSSELTLEFMLVEANVPEVARTQGLGIEQAARNVRYSAFDKIITGREEYNTLLLAHNATDHAETVIINMLRGSGVLGMCGIPPVRDYIARPLIGIEKSDIVELLDRFDVPYVTDSTNLSDEYTRNYVRHNVIPHLCRITSSPEQMIGRMSANLRSVYSYMNENAKSVLSEISDPFCFDVNILRSLHPALFATVFTSLVKRVTGYAPAETHIRAVADMLELDGFAVSLTGAFDFECQRGVCTFVKKSKEGEDATELRLREGLNIIEGTNGAVYVGETDTKTFLNIYNFSIHVYLSRDIINKGLYIRYRRDGDSYKYGGHTRRLKKVFNDRGIPPFLRDCIPVFYDDEGIVWVPGLSARDGAGGGSNSVRITLLLSTVNECGGKKLICATPFTGKAN